MSDALAQRQAAIMRAILDEDAPLPEGWGNSQAAGIGVYRGNYRGALTDAMAATFERTKRYVGDGPFQQASAHHLIDNPPSSWTIDDAGSGFSETCAELFGDNPEVAELAWLEWAMLQVANAPDTEPMAPEALAEATADFDDDQWMGLKVEFQPRSAARMIDYNLTGLWNALEEDGQEMPDIHLSEPKGCIVWREGERATFMAIDPESARGFVAMQAGATYGALIAMLAGEDASDEAVQEAAMRAGRMLGGWLQEGMIVAVNA